MASHYIQVVIDDCCTNACGKETNQPHHHPVRAPPPLTAGQPGPPGLSSSELSEEKGCIQLPLFSRTPLFTVLSRDKAMPLCQGDRGEAALLSLNVN